MNSMQSPNTGVGGKDFGNKKKEHECDNLRFGFDCMCDFMEEHPGDKTFTCEFCGLYHASESRCNKCEEE